MEKSNCFKEMAKRNKQRKVFIRARKDGEKLHYIGYVSKNNLWHKTLINSWLFRFGGYKEVRYYDPKTKKCVGIWDLKKHDDYCEKHHYNDMVGCDNVYFTEVTKPKDKGKYGLIMEETKEQTLREYLDSIDIHEGDDSRFVLQEMNKSTEMAVSRRYIECEAWNYLLDCVIVDYTYPYYDLWGNKTIKLFLERKDGSKDNG